MNKSYLFKASALIYLFGLILILSWSAKVYAVKYEPVLKNDPDSLKTLVDNCPVDTCKFAILSNFFWQTANKDVESVKQVGEWAYEVIKNSGNLRALSDGYDIKGFIFKQEEIYDSAFYYFEKALLTSAKGGLKYRMAWSYFHLGEISYLFGDFNVALKNMKNSTSHFNKIGYYLEAGKSMYYIADMYERMGFIDSAIVYNNLRLDLYKKLNDKISEISLYLELSSFYKDHNDSRKSLEFLKEALKETELINNVKALFNVYLAIGDFFAEQKKNYPLALNYYDRVMEIAKRNNIKSTRALLSNKIGDVYLEEGKDSLALKFNLESLEIAKELKHRHTISNSYKSLGLSYKRLGDSHSALQCFKNAYETGCNVCPAVMFHEVLINIGDIYYKTGKQDSAIVWYRKSLELAEKFHSMKEISLSDFRIGDYYRKINQGPNAEREYFQSIQTAIEVGNVALIKSVADTLSDFYSEKKDYSAAYKYLNMSKAMADSISEIDRHSDMTELAMKFEFEKINKENEVKQGIAAAEIKRQKVFRDFLIIISFLLVGTGFVLFNSYRRKKKDNKLLSDQKNQIERISGELHESDEMKLRFFSNISHEFRTPLTLIINPLQNLLESGSDNPEYKRQLESIYKNAYRLLDLTNQILDLQKLDAGKLTLNLEKTEIIKYSLGIISSFESLCGKKNNTLRFCSNCNSAITDIDKDKIGKILVNLLSNAFKYCYEDTSIEISLDISGNQFVLSVSDNGIGIPAEYINNVFKRYYQVPSDNQSAGTGIGLAYVKELVVFMNGDVTINSRVNEGTKICVQIPVNVYEVKEMTRYSVDIPKTRKLPSAREFDPEALINGDLNENSVLIVEDNDELRDYIADLLKTDFNVILSDNGEDGLQRASQFLPDVIISDVMMPRKNGFELCIALKKDERTCHIPVILLTARDSNQSSIEGYMTGADDYIIKPFDNELLVLKVKNIIATHEAARKQFDLKSILTVDNLKIGVTDKEFMKKCIAVINLNINDSGFSVEKLAEELAFSNRNFYRKIKALTNQTPADLVRVYRMHYARQLLRNTKMKVFEIALATGYEDVNRFSQAFKKQFGALPSESLRNVVS